MKSASSDRTGVGCPVEEPEVLPVYQPPEYGTVGIGRVRFDRGTTLESPCFWLLIGATVAGGLVYLILRENRR